MWQVNLGCLSGPLLHGEEVSRVVPSSRGCLSPASGRTSGTLWVGPCTGLCLLGASVSVQALLTSEHLHEQRGQGHVGGGGLCWAWGATDIVHREAWLSLCLGRNLGGCVCRLQGLNGQLVGVGLAGAPSGEQRPHLWVRSCSRCWEQPLRKVHAPQRGRTLMSKHLQLLA